MTITAACECGWKMSVKDELAGKLIHCPLCQEEILVPQPAQGESAGALNSTSASPTPAPRPGPSRGSRTNLVGAVFALGALALAAWWLLGEGNALREVRSAKKGLRVLFVGNSFTYVNNLPDQVRQLAEAAGEELPLLAVQEAPGGCTLRGHWENGKVLKLLEEIRWDYVVLQEQSQIGSFSREQRSQEMVPYARQLDAKIRSRGTRTVLFLTWGYKEGDRRNVPGDSYAAMQERLEQGYRELAGELAAQVAPVGLAWARARALKPELELWAGDGIHPSLPGTYLTACVFYAVLYGRDPRGIAFTAGLKASVAKFLQEVAGAVAARNASAGGSPRR
jgi:hypothetical protein